MPAPLLEVRDLKKGYRSPDGGVTMILDVPHFSLEAGEQVGLRGGSGTGKTTFLNLVAGILRPDAGSILLDGRRLEALKEEELDRLRGQRIGYVYQTFNLLQGFSALENVMLGMMFGAGSDRALAEELLRRVGLGDRLHYRPRQLSVGQLQRVAVARAMANRPAMVLADEPTGNLDRRSADEALELIRTMCSEARSALLLVSHDPHVLSQVARTLPFEELNRACMVEGAA